jgi:hypothetical protein
MARGECVSRPTFEITLEFFGTMVIFKSNRHAYFPRTIFGSVVNPALIVLLEASTQVGCATNVMLLGL